MKIVGPVSSEEVEDPYAREYAAKLGTNADELLLGMKPIPVHVKVVFNVAPLES